MGLPRNKKGQFKKGHSGGPGRRRKTPVTLTNAVAKLKEDIINDAMSADPERRSKAVLDLQRLVKLESEIKNSDEHLSGFDMRAMADAIRSMEGATAQPEDSIEVKSGGSG